MVIPRRGMTFVHCNIQLERYDEVVGHLLLPDAMPTLNAVHLLPRRLRIRPAATSSRQRVFLFQVRI